MIVAAFAAVYAVWGSTYLAIRVTVESLPPFLAGAVRFVIAGAALLALLKMRGSPSLNGQQWRHAAVTGTLLLVGGNGLVMWAEKTVPSGLTAVLIALTPVWFALLDWARPGGMRPQVKTVAGIVVGFIGVIMLVRSRHASGLEAGDWLAAVAIIVAGAFWASGSLYGKYKPKRGIAVDELGGANDLRWRGAACGQSCFWRAIHDSMVGRNVTIGCGAGLSHRVWFVDRLQRVCVFTEALQTERGLDLRVCESCDRRFSWLADFGRNV